MSWIGNKPLSTPLNEQRSHHVSTDQQAGKHYFLGLDNRNDIIIHLVGTIRIRTKDLITVTSIQRPENPLPQPINSNIRSELDTETTIAQILQHLPMQDDPIPTLLKGHLLVEETLRKFLARKVANQAAAQEAQLSFHQVCCMTKAIYNPHGMGWLWNAIRLLSRLRNDLAHHLEPTGLEQRIEAFQECVEKGALLPAPSGMRQQMGRLALTLATLIAFIHVGLEPMPSELGPNNF